MQLWMEINVVTLHKVVEMPQQMPSVIKAKGLLRKACVQLLFWTGSVYACETNLSGGYLKGHMQLRERTLIGGERKIDI